MTMNPNRTLPSKARHVIARLAVVVLAMLALAVSAQAQRGKITAKIVDAKTGEPLLKATLQVLQTRRGALSNEGGMATIINVDPDENYTVVAKYAGYLPDTIYHVKVQSDITTALSYKLGTKEKTVIVTAQAPLVE